MRLAKALGAWFAVLAVSTFLGSGQSYGIVASLVAIGVGIYVWRQLKPKEKTPQPPPEGDN